MRLIKELGVIDMLKSILLMLFTTILIGGFMNFTFGNNGITLVGCLFIILLLVLIKYLPNLNN